MIKGVYEHCSYYQDRDFEDTSKCSTNLTRAFSKKSLLSTRKIQVKKLAFPIKPSS